MLNEGHGLKQFFITISANFPFLVSKTGSTEFHFWCVAQASLDRNLIHSADACFLVMACVAGYARAAKTLRRLERVFSCGPGVLPW